MWGETEEIKESTKWFGSKFMLKIMRRVTDQFKELSRLFHRLTVWKKNVLSPNLNFDLSFVTLLWGFLYIVWPSILSNNKQIHKTKAVNKKHL